MEWWEEWILWDDSFEPLPLVPAPERPPSAQWRQWFRLWSEYEAGVIRWHKLSILRAHIVNATIRALDDLSLLTSHTLI